MKEHIQILDGLRPEDTRFSFDPVNRNLCFGGGGGGLGGVVSGLTGALGMGGGWVGGGWVGGEGRPPTPPTINPKTSIKTAKP